MHTHTGCEHPDLQRPVKSGVKQETWLWTPSHHGFLPVREGAALYSHRHDRSDPVHGNNLSVHMPENFVLVWVLSDNACLQYIYFPLQPQASSGHCCTHVQRSAKDAQVTEMCVCTLLHDFLLPRPGQAEGVWVWF